MDVPPIQIHIAPNTHVFDSSQLDDVINMVEYMLDGGRYLDAGRLPPGVHACIGPSRARHAQRLAVNQLGNRLPRPKRRRCKWRAQQRDIRQRTRQ